MSQGLGPRRRLVLWRGTHSSLIQDLIQSTWKSDDLLILLPPQGVALDFLPLLPSGEVSFAGDWDVRPAFSQPASPNWPELPSFGLFTSGTTGGPKLVLYSKKNVESSLAGIRSFFTKHEFRSVYCYPQPFHTFGLTLGYLQCLLYGLKCHASFGPYSSRSHNEWLSLDDPSLLTLGTPTHFKDLLQHVRQTGLKPRATLSCIIGGAQVSKRLWQDCQDRLNIEAPSIGYGATEACPGVTHLPPGRLPEVDGEIGFSLPEVSLKVRPDEGLEFSGPNLCLAAIQSGELVFPKSHLILDRVESLPSGSLCSEGRLDFVINRGGEKFSPEAVESFLFESTGLRVVCFGVSDPRLGEELAFLVPLTPGSKERVLASLKSRYGRSFSENVLAVETFPLNASAKVDRKKAKALYLKGDV